MQTFTVECGEYKTKVELDQNLFDSYESKCIEAATVALEDFFNSSKCYSENLSIYTIVKESKNENSSRFIALTYFILNNASLYDLAAEFELETNEYQKNL